MQICASTDNLSAPARSDHALHGIPPRRELSSRGRFACVFSGRGLARPGLAWPGLARRGKAGQGDVIALIPAFRAMRAEAWQG